MKIHFPIFLLFISFAGFAQRDSIAYSRDYVFEEGVFLTINQFKNNSPIPKSALVSSYPKTQADFLSQLFTQKHIVFKDSAGTEQKVETTAIWGYCQNRSIYINFNNQFNRVNVIGTLCHFTAYVTRTMEYHNQIDYKYGPTNTVDELRQFVLNTKSNQILDFNVTNMEGILQNDTELYNQFMALKKREKPDAIFIYLRKYNEMHPLYLPTM